MFITTRSIKFLLGGLLLCVAMAQVVPPAPDPNGYIIYDEGNCNLILSVTHGGSLRPDNNEVPDRTVCPGKFRWGCLLNIEASVIVVLGGMSSVQIQIIRR